MLLVFTVILVALIFTYTNGFHDTANAIATVVGTKVLTPRQAILLATVTNLLGAMTGAAVAKTIASGLVDTKFIPPEISSQMLICALLAAIFWNLLTWYFGLPSSSSHALIGGLCGAAFAAARGNWHAIIWSKMPEAGQHWWTGGGILFKVVIPMLISPLLGFIIAFVIMAALYLLLQGWRPRTVTRTFGRLQLFSSAYMGFSHGTNDAQKTMGIIFLALVAGTVGGNFDSLGNKWNFLYAPDPLDSVSAAQVELGRLYLKAGDEKQAFSFFQKAADGKNQTGRFLYANALKTGQGTKANPVLAENILNQLAADKFDAASVKPGTFITRKFQDLPASSQESFRWLNQKADNGNADAMLLLGVAYAEGDGVETNGAKVLKLFQKAAKRNHPAAFYDLGLLYLNGIGVAQDYKKAESAFKSCVKKEAIPLWIKIICALTMAAGTAIGGWRIIRTLGHKLVKLQPVHGFAAETAGASVLLGTAMLGMPVSTTHVITMSIMGVGAARRLSALKWVLAEQIVWAWIFTLPVSAAIAYGLVKLVEML
jgi:phosphate/sulfate permease